MSGIEKQILKLIKDKNTELAQLKKELDKFRESNKSTQQIEKESDQRIRTFNALCAKEWALHSRSVWNDVSSPRSKNHLDHGATFPKKLAERAIRMYSNQGDLVFDPFLGTGTTIISAHENQRRYVGIELNKNFVSLPNTIIDNIAKNSIIYGDCIRKIDKLDNESIQLTFTSPPYADLLIKVQEDRTERHKTSKIVLDNNSKAKPYSTNSNDLGNMNFEEYSNKILELMEKLYLKTKKGGYNIWVVKDYRDTKNGIPYVDLHGKIAEIGQKAGFAYHDLIIWDQNERRALVLLGYPSVFYVNQNHSYLIVLRKK